MVRTSGHRTARTARTAPRALLPLFLALVLSACGDGEGGAASPPAARPAPVAAAPLPPVSRAEKAAFALERLTRGPLRRTGAFEIPSLHLLNLQHARRDLIALPDETVALLRDEDRRASLTRLTSAGEARPSWHSVLDVLLGLPVHPVDLALAWTEGVEKANDAPLHRRAAYALAATRDPKAAPRLLTLLRLRARDREVGRIALEALLALGDPWDRQALERVYRYGGSRTWGRVPLLIAGAAEGPAPTDLDADALAWWALLAETGAPVPFTDLDRVVRPAWAGLVLRLRDDVWPSERLELGLAQRFRRLVAPARVLEGSGGIPHRRDRTALLPPRGVQPGGGKTAAQARVLLAEAGFDAYVQAVRHDLRSRDVMLADIAAASRASGAADHAAELHAAVVDQYVASLGGFSSTDTTAAGGSLDRLAELRPEAAVAYAWTILEQARPWAAHEVPLKIAYEVLAEREDARLLETVSALARSPEAGEASVALSLIRWARDPRFVPAVLAGIASVPPESQALQRRLLVWLQTAPDAGLTDEAAEAFVRRYGTWIDETLDAEAAGLVTGLLDLGAPGFAAYAEGLRGPRRHVYLSGLLSRPGVVPPVLAEALLAPIDSDTSILERHAVWVAIYRSAPPEAAGYLVAARNRLTPQVRAETDDILEVVRHRSATPAAP